MEPTAARRVRRATRRRRPPPRSAATPHGVDARGFLADLADTAASRWREQDQGIWEVRGAPRDLLYSKLMCWVALIARVGLAGARRRGPARRAGRRRATRSPEAMLTHGWNETAGSFMQSFDSDDLDAFQPGDPDRRVPSVEDPRMRSTIRRLRGSGSPSSGVRVPLPCGLGLAAEEGTFALCTFWLVDALVLSARSSVPRGLFESRSRTRTTSACSRRRSRRGRAQRSGTSRRRSATSGWSTPRGRSRRRRRTGSRWRPS